MLMDNQSLNPAEFLQVLCLSVKSTKSRGLVNLKKFF